MHELTSPGTARGWQEALVTASKPVRARGRAMARPVNDSCAPHESIFFVRGWPWMEFRLAMLLKSESSLVQSSHSESWPSGPEGAPRLLPRLSAFAATAVCCCHYCLHLRCCQ